MPALARIPQETAIVKAVSAWTARLARTLKNYRLRDGGNPEALRLVLNRKGRHFDPGVVWALIKTVGFYPAGTVMLTESGYVTLSLSPNPRDLGRPHCRVLLRPDSSLPDPESPEVQDPMPAGQEVARTLAPEEFAVDTNVLLAA
jgi:hypothetical protein